MTTYEMLDRVADSVNPVLAWQLSFGHGLHGAMGTLAGAHEPGILGNVATLASVGVIYLMGALDRKMGVWVAMGLDYSTHTAVCVACVVSLWWIDRRARIPATMCGRREVSPPRDVLTAGP